MDSESDVVTLLEQIDIDHLVIEKLKEQQLASLPNLSDMMAWTPKMIADALGVPLGLVMPNNFGKPVQQLLFDFNGLPDHPRRYSSSVPPKSLGRQLQDGIPLLRQDLTSSLPSVPSEKDHAPCLRSVNNLPQLPAVPEHVLHASNSTWYGEDGEDSVLHYSTESDIAYIVRRFLEDVLRVLKLPLSFRNEVTIQQIRPDISVLLMRTFLVGVVEVKKPGKNVLLEPTVLGELLDQMLLVEGFYGMGPAIGILTTAEEWLISWFPADTDALAHVDIRVEHPVTPMKQKSSVPSGTPTQQRGIIHSIDAVTGEFDDSYTDEEIERVLCTTAVMNIHQDPVGVLRHLYCAFRLMSKACLHHSPGLSRCLLKFHRGNDDLVTYHSVSYDAVYSTVDFDKFPKMNVKTLIALEDLGRGATGKAWLCVTSSKPRSAPCVLKFYNENSSGIEKEKNLWHLLYPEFKSMVTVQKWSGADALVMPHFSTVLEHERKSYRDILVEVLTTRFMEKGKIHKDVRWRNIGKYRKNDGDIALVVFDLHDVVDYQEELHLGWVDESIEALFVKS